LGDLGVGRRGRGCRRPRRRRAPGGPACDRVTNQRETALLWERSTGTPIDRAIVWQDRRTAARCRELPAGLIRARTGLLPDPYFSATKLEWLLGRSDAEQSELAFGTGDAWLVWQLTEGRVHATDVTNASRTMLLDLASLEWNGELLEVIGVDCRLLPRLVRSSEIVGEAKLLLRCSSAT
jgi:glycerol kinase